MQQIADWLEKLGMSEYAQRFAENAIDFSVLSDLTDQDLEKLGVLLGHRRKLLRAIANLEVIEKGAPAVPVAPAPSATQRAAETAERRQVTVMFTRAFLIGVAGTPVAWSTSSSTASTAAIAAFAEQYRCRRIWRATWRPQVSQVTKSFAAHLHIPSSHPLARENGREQSEGLGAFVGKEFPRRVGSA